MLQVLNMMNKNYGQLYCIIIILFLPSFSFSQGSDCNGQPFIVEIAGDSTVCIGSSNILDAGAGYTTYLWSNGATSQTILVAEAGLFSVTVTNDENCETSDSIQVLLLELPAFQINGDATLCQNEVDVLIASPGFSDYNWSNGSDAQVISISSPETYFLTVTDVNGCSDVDSVEVVSGAADVMILGDTINCQMDSILLSLNDTFDSYTWSNGADTPQTWVSSTANYSVTVTADNACGTIDSIDIIISNPMVNINGDTTLCGGEFTTLIGSTGFSTYDWSTGSTSQAVVVEQVGAYSLTVTDHLGCEAVDSVEVVEEEAPSLSILGGDTFCAEDSLQLSVATNGISYVWSTGIADYPISINTASDYSVTATSTNGCEAVAHIQVQELPAPVPQIQGDTSFCMGEIGQLFVNDLFDDYVWSNSDQSIQTEVSTTDTYFVTVTASNGCTGVDSIDVVVNDPQVDISGELGFCPDNSTVLIASSGFNSYLWSNGISSQLIATSVEGTYSVTVTDSDGCFATDSVEVAAFDVPVAMINGDSTFCTGNSIVLDGGNEATTYDWSVLGEIGQTIDVNTPGTYSLTVTNSFGCEASDDILIMEYPNPIPQIEGIPLICSNNPTILQGEDGFESYEWSGGSLTQSLDVQLPGWYTLTVVDSNNCQGQNSLMVEVVNQAAFIDINGSLDFCEGETTTLSIDDVFTSFLWSNGDTTSSVTITEAGPLSVSGIDINGCPSIDSVTIVQNNNPEVLISGSLDYCGGEFTTLSTTEIYASYNWSTGENDTSIEVNQEGIVSVDVIDTNGCSGSDIVFVNEIPAPDPFITGDLSLCPDQVSLLTVNSGFESYNWSTGDTTSMIQVSDGGIYGVTVTENTGCLGSYLIFVSQVPGVDLTVSVSDTSICEGETVELLAEGDFVFVNWSNAPNSAMTIADTSGMYIVEAGNNFGCTVYDTVSVDIQPLPMVEILGDSILCYDGESILTTNFDPQSFDYQWSLNGATADSLLINQAGNYDLTVTDDIGCSGEASIEIIQAANPIDSIIGLTNFCPELFTTIAVEGDFEEALWSTNDSATELTISTAGLYSVTVTDTYGCKISDSVEISTFEPPQVSIIGDEILCEGTTNILRLEGDFEQFVWSDQSDEDSLIINAEGLYSVEAISNEGCLGTDSIQVSLQLNPTVELQGDSLFCESTTMALTANSSNQSVQYDWSNGSNDVDSITISQIGNYFVTVTDEFGCRGSDSLNINFYPSDSLDIEGVTAFCPGDTTTLIATGSYPFIEWSTGEVESSINILDPGNYAVTVTDEFGCVRMESLELTWLPAPNVSITGDTSFCENSFVQLEAQTDGVFVEWSNGTTDTQLAVEFQGEYTAFAINDEGCINSSSIQIAENPTPNIEFTGTFDFCVGDSTQIGTLVSYASYQWSDNSIDSILVADVDGLYELTVIDENGCQGSDSIFLTENPLPQIGLNDTILCASEALILDAGDEFAAYLWSDNSESASLSVTTAGEYSVTVTDENHCTNSVGITVNEFDPPQPQIEGVFELCMGDSIMLSVVDTFIDYEWSNASTQSATEVYDIGAITVIVTDQYGCKGADTVLINELPTPVFEILGEFSFCEGSSTVLSATSGFENYEWTGGILADSIVIEEEGNISLIVTNAEGCTAEENVEVEVLALPVPNFQVEEIIDCQETSTFLGDENPTTEWTYKWEGPAINDTNQNDPNPEVDQSGTYNVIVTDINTTCSSEVVTIEVLADTITPIFTFNVASLINCYEPEILATYLLDDQSISTNSSWVDASGNLLPQDGDNKLTISSSGWYFLTVQNSDNFCEFVDSIFIDEDFERPIVEAGPDALINCDHPEIDLSGSSSTTNVPLSYAWSTISGNILSGANTNTPRINEEGTYILRLMNEENGCVNSDSVLVIGDFIEPTAIAGTDQFISCLTGEAALDGSNSSQGDEFRYIWTNNSGFFLDDNLTPTVSNLGLYFLEVIDWSNGCSDIDSVLVINDPEAINSIEVKIDHPVCSGDNDGRIRVENIVGGSPPFIYSLNGAHYSTDRIFSSLLPGNYVVNVEDARGCRSFDNIEIIDGDTLSVELGLDQSIHFGQKAILEPIISHSGSTIIDQIWSNSNQESCDNCSVWEVQPDFTTQYFIELINKNGCVAVDDVYVFVDRRKKMHIPNAFSPNGDEVNDRFTLFGGENVVKIETLQVFDRWGTLVFQNKNFLPNDEILGWDGNFKGQALNTDVYIYQASVLFSDGEIRTFKGDVLLLR